MTNSTMTTENTSKNTFHTDIIIIGAGPVGLFTVFQAGMQGLRCHVFDALPDIGGQCTALYPEKPIYDIPAYPKITGAALITQLENQAKPFKPHYHLGQKIIALDDNKDKEYRFAIRSNLGVTVNAKAIIIAGGAGCFGPNRPPLEDIESYEQKSVFYYVKNPDDFAHKKIIIAGGGDSALDWAIYLSEMTDKITLVHRRDKFRAAPDSVTKMENLVKAGKIDLKTGYQLNGLGGNDGYLDTVTIKAIKSEETIAIDADILLPFFGLATDLGVFHDWSLDINRKQISVNPITQMTSRDFIYAVGDICDYQDKLGLILTGFAESATASHHLKKTLNPDQDSHFEHSTTKGVIGF